MFCIKCGTQLMDGAAFCHKCGTAAPGANAQQPAAASAPLSAAPVATPQQPPVPEQAQVRPQQPAYQAIGSNAQPGSNVVSFPGLSGVLPVVEGLAEAPDEVQQAGLDMGAVGSLRSRLQTAFDFLADRHGARGRLNRAMTVMKQAGQAIAQWKNPSEALSSAQPETWMCTIELTQPEAELYNLCARQSELAEGYETRLLRTCRSCRQQRIINPQFQRMQKEKKQLQGWVMMQRNIFLAMSRLKNDPDFVCNRCQGLEADERQIVLCPQCGTPHTNVLLGTCAKCGYDLACPAPVVEGDVEIELDAPAAPPQPEPVQPQPEEPPQPAPAEQPAKPGGGKILQGRCSDCGNVIRIPLAKIPPQGIKGKCSECGRELTIRPPKPKPRAPEAE